MTPISAVTVSLQEAAAATASPSHALLERLTPEQHVSCVRVMKWLPLQLRVALFDFHGPGLTHLPSKIWVMFFKKIVGEVALTCL